MLGLNETQNQNTQHLRKFEFKSYLFGWDCISYMQIQTIHYLPLKKVLNPIVVELPGKDNIL